MSKSNEPYTAWVMPGYRYSGTFIREVTITEHDDDLFLLSYMHPDGVQREDHYRRSEDYWIIFNTELDALRAVKEKAAYHQWTVAGRKGKLASKTFQFLSRQLQDLLDRESQNG